MLTKLTMLTMPDSNILINGLEKIMIRVQNRQYRIVLLCNTQLCNDYHQARKIIFSWKCMLIAGHAKSLNPSTAEI
jgi:hypothetical protein